MKARDASKKQARAKVKGKLGQTRETITDEYQKDETLSPSILLQRTLVIKRTNLNITLQNLWIRNLILVWQIGRY